jgi:trans-aconitate methyltransferase
MSSIGTSTLYSTEWIIDRLRDIAPSSIIDVGCGWGRWGFLAREFLEVWAHRFTQDEWSLRIDAVDIHPGTWTPVHNFIYDETIQADVRYWRPARPYDVAICGDVIEHLEKAEGEEVLRRLLGWCPNLLLGIPLGPGWLRSGHFGNDHEAHLAEWDTSDMDFFDVKAYKLTQTEDRLGYGLFWLT